MKIGVISRIGEFPETEWENEFRTFGRYGEKASHLELMSNYPYLGPLDYTKRQGKILRQYAEKNRLGVIIHLLPNQRGISKELSRKMFSSEKASAEFLEHEKKLQEVFNIGSLNKGVRNQSVEEVRLTLKIAKDIGAGLIIIHGGVYINKEDYRKHLEASRKSLEQLNSYFKKAGIKLCVENLPSLGHIGSSVKEYPQNAEDWLYLIEGLDNVGACLDTGHANVPGDVLDYYEKIKSTGKLWDMHIHDNLGDRDNHLQVGKGNISFEELFRRLKKDGYNGYCSIELDTWCREKMETHERTEGLSHLRKLIE